VQREADIIEEILRVYGYNNIEFSNKLNTSISFDSDIETKVENITANQLTALGFNETMANSLTKPEYNLLSENINDDAKVMMLNPLSNDLAVMRQSMLFSGLESVSYNLNRKNTSLKFYEFGKTYHKYNDKYQEDKHLTLFVTGNRTKDSWGINANTSGFFYAKGVINSILERLGINNLKVSPIKNDVFFYRCPAKQEFSFQDYKTKKIEIIKGVIGGMGFSEGFSFLKQESQMLVINEKGDIVNSFAFKSTNNPVFENGLALIVEDSKDEKKYYIDKEGNKYSIFD
jgi:phenylalanyl-tRNA synthetase beta subunit